jgi:predicted metal-dependent hydrolase
MAESGELIARCEMELPFSVMRSARRTLRIVVSPDGSVAAHIPKEATVEEIVARVSRRGSWIKRELFRCEKKRPRTPARQCVSGETHLFLGKQYRLVVTSESAPARPPNLPAVARRACQGWPRLRGHPKGLGLDWAEHGGILDRIGAGGAATS